MITKKNVFSKYYDRINSYPQTNFKFFEFPFVVDIELTNFCNLKCIMCNQVYMKREKGFMEEELFKKIVDECIENKAGIRLIGLGEPFLHKKIIDFVKYVKNKKGNLNITNNGFDNNRRTNENFN